MPINHYLSKKHAAEILDVSVRTIDRYISRRIIRPRILKTGSVRIPIDQIMKCFKPSVFNSSRNHFG
ncbi:MAG: helix-turn-helix domain-containing protein [Chloroflexi bacterium]|nr:helix-turn-helix domain-containing protein [Chloroflexota bacterium]